jgi:hypothetical protein
LLENFIKSHFLLMKFVIWMISEIGLLRYNIAFYRGPTQFEWFNYCLGLEEISQCLNEINEI